ncbi:hypothetical protein EZY14_017155 [Kordia sp. TARA_039_SRF]|nr:hypothetical protein EZY14_017155 [Kordia sp. TARA_039_SRF]
MEDNINKAIDYVAKIIECDKTELCKESKMHSHHKWDSLGHLLLMVKLEEDYNIEINDETINKYSEISNIAKILT